jgi:hypothetical protein
MAEFSYPPLTPDPDPAPLSPTVDLNPPMVGTASPFIHVDGQNRDLILESIRAWLRTVLYEWTKAWQAYLEYWLALVAAWLNEFVVEADAYITDHAISGYSTRLTATPLNPTGTTVVVFAGVDVDHRPVVVGDIAIDESDDSRYGIVTSVIDTTHAVVQVTGSIKGRAGHGWWVTATTISASGTTDVVLTAESDRVPQVNDLVSDLSSALRYGIITVVSDPTHVTVAPLGTLRGLPGFGWWATTTPITHSGTTPVVLSSGPDRLPQVNDLVVDDTASAAFGEITVVTDATHVTVAYVGTLQGPPGDTTGTVVTVQAGTGITVDNTDPENPVVSADISSAVLSVQPGVNVDVDSTDPLNPIVSAPGSTTYNDPSTLAARDSDGRISAVDPIAGHNVATKSYVDSNFSPAGSGVQSVETTSDFLEVDNTDPHNPVVTIPALDNPGLNAGSSYVIAFHNNQASDGKWGLQDATNTDRGLYFAAAGNASDAVIGGGNTQGDSYVRTREFIVLSSVNTLGTFAGDVTVVEFKPNGPRFNMTATGGRGAGQGLPQYAAVDLPNFGIGGDNAGAMAFNTTTGRPCFYDGISAWTDL